VAGQVFLTIYNQGNAFQHSVVFDKGDPASWVHEFEHQVLYLGNKPFFDRIPIRVHKPVRIYIPIDKIAPSLIQKVIQGEAVEKVMLRWFRYQEKTKSDSEYFRHIFEAVSFDQCRFVMPDAKNPLFDRYDHGLELSFRYKKVTWVYMQGNLMVSDEWHGSEFEEGEEAEVEEEEETTEEEVAPAEHVDETTKKVTLSEAKFLPEEGKTDFNQKCNVTVKVAYLQETNKKKVLFKLFSAYNNNTQDMQHEIEAFESDGKADAALTLHYNDEYYSDTAKPADASVEYFVKVTHPEADEVESERLKLPFKKQQTVQFIEIPDVLFNHNSAVPMIDADEKLISAVVATLAFASKNTEKEATIYGHTDSSGETDYNIKLSELRCKSVKAFIDNKPQEFVSICKEKSKVEDYQTFLSVLTKKYSWECDPGSIDNQDGPKTKEALKQFQIDYNLFYGKSISEDGRIGPETWEAFFNVIIEQILGNANAQSGNSALKLTYGKNNGIYPCGEKYAQDAYAKKGRKSQKDRRVEIVFSDPSQPIEDTPYVDTIVMEPIEIVADPPSQKLAAKIKKFTMWCSHQSKGKRIGKQNQVLEIVPATDGDEITLQVESTGDPLDMSWNIRGYKKTDLTGDKATFNVSGFETQAINFITPFFTGDILQAIIPHKINVLGTDPSGNKIKGLIKVFPNTKYTIAFDPQKDYPSLFEIIEGIDKGLDFTGHKILSVQKPKGSIQIAGQYKEDPTCSKAFFAVIISGKFDPLIGLKLDVPIPIKGFLSAIPDALLDWIANIYAFIRIEGKIRLVLDFERKGVDDFAVSGGPNISVSGSVGMGAKVANGKLLLVEAALIVEVNGDGKMYAEIDVCGNGPDDKKWEIGAKVTAKFEGVRGTITWKFFDSKWGSSKMMQISDPISLMKDKKHTLFTNKKAT
jgi:type VI secretion system secreted protein Hcp